jgi:hypothetical protein
MDHTRPGARGRHEPGGSGRTLCGAKAEYAGGWRCSNGSARKRAMSWAWDLSLTTAPHLARPAVFEASASSDDAVPVLAPPFWSLQKSSSLPWERRPSALGPLWGCRAKPADVSGGQRNATKRIIVLQNGPVILEEVKPLGVHAAIEAGPFRTEFLVRSGKLGAKELPEYRGTVGRSHTCLQTQSGKQPGDPPKAVNGIWESITLGVNLPKGSK